MALTLTEIKELIEFGRAHGLQALTAEGLSIVYGGPAVTTEDKQASDASTSSLPEELRHYSAVGKAAFGKSL